MSLVNTSLADCVDWIYFENNEIHRPVNELALKALELFEIGKLIILETPFPDTKTPKYFRQTGIRQISLNTNVQEHTPASNINTEFELALFQIGRLNFASEQAQII